MGRIEAVLVARAFLLVGILIAALCIVSSASALVSMCPFDPKEGVPIELLPSPLVISSSFQAAGAGKGSITLDLDLVHSVGGNLTNMELYTADLAGRGNLQFADEVTIDDQKIVGSQAVMLAAGGYSPFTFAPGSLIGSTGIHTFGVTPNVNLSDPANATVFPLCSKVSTVSYYSLSQGQAASTSIVDFNTVSQEFAAMGTGSLGMTGNYHVRQGFSGELLDSMDARVKMLGSDLEFAAKFDFSGMA